MGYEPFANATDDAIGAHVHKSSDFLRLRVELEHYHARVARPPWNAFTVQKLLDSWQQLGLIANTVQAFASHSLNLPCACRYSNDIF